MENKIFDFCFSFSWENSKTNFLKRSRLTLWVFCKYGLHVIQEQARVKLTEIFRCAMFTQTA